MSNNELCVSAMQIRYLTFLFISLSFYSCLKKETPMVLPPPGDAINETLHTGSDYGRQFYYNLKEAKVVHSGLVDSWHLAFETTSDGYGVFLNGGVGMALVSTNKKKFSELSPHDCKNILWRQDDPCGQRETSAIGNWNLNQNTRNKIYILRLDAAANTLLGFRLDTVCETWYRIEIGNLGAANTNFYTIYKDPTKTFSYFNMSTRKQVEGIEPVKESWDLLFTRYGFTFYDQNPPLPYIVTGVLLNPAAQAFKDSSASFYDITADIIPSQPLTKNRDVIGYNWKVYDYDLGIYHVRQDYNFIIHTALGEYYKLRFLSFYDDKGVKGAPGFEFKQIQ